MTSPSADPLHIECKPIWQESTDGGQRWGVAVIKPSQLTAVITALRDETVQSQVSTVTFTLEALQAKRVCIAGDFNGWDTQSHPLAKTSSGAWQIRMPLPPGRYEYQFYVDGYWHNDPHSTRRVRNLFGTENDVIEVPAGS